MIDVDDIAFVAKDETAPVLETVSAAKLHVLALGPIKERLGGKWFRLSGLVHKLFEASISRARGPQDFFIRLDEMSYAVVFRSLSVDDASRVCSAIAREVCLALYGDQVDEVSVRNVVGRVELPPDVDLSDRAKLIEAILEQSGTETVVTQSAETAPLVPVTTVATNVLKPSSAPIELIGDVHARLEALGLKAGFFPVWELQRGVSSSLFLLPYSGRVENMATSGYQALATADAGQAAEVEIMLLNAAAAYAARVVESQKVCAVGTGVSYETLSRLQSRIQYITALQKLRPHPSTPFILKIEQIPEGTPAARIGELSAMLQRANIRVTLEFQSIAVLPTFDFRLSAQGMGGAVPKNADGSLTSVLVRRLMNVATAQKAFVFVDRLDTIERARIARQSKVRFGSGNALGTLHFSGLEKPPEFPIMLSGTR